MFRTGELFTGNVSSTFELAVVICLWIVTIIYLCLIVKNPDFRQRPSNLLIFYFLASESVKYFIMNGFIVYADKHRQMLAYECSTKILLEKMFEIISMSFLIFLSFERYFKLMKEPHEYEFLIQSRRLKTSILVIWMATICFSAITVPNYGVLSGSIKLTSTNDLCIYSRVVEPAFAMISTIITPCLSYSVLIILNIIIAKKIFSIITNVKQPGILSKENEQMAKKVGSPHEFKFCIMSILLALQFFGQVPIGIFYLVDTLSSVKVLDYEIPRVIFDIADFFSFFGLFYKLLIIVTMNDTFSFEKFPLREPQNKIQSTLEY
ncbi:hypothetical protein RF11_11989 [Thelohanellus kitauei]|uniref:G-protein coupled receptors family 1 profile domain-containing protein n=1 Tax=Thelohanellus kitauei TaxID=669202 RepID=A0A0C2MX44_THEKT|nr:hypothetical protein RF11_11989 [Thelohanellus kitauei]